MEQPQLNITPLAFRHVCILVRDRQKAMQQLSVLMGAHFSKVFDAIFPETIVHGKKIHCEVKLAFGQIGPIEIELLEPGKGEGIWWEFLRTRGEGVHHLGMLVPNLDKELSRFRDLGIGVLQCGEDEHVRFAFIDTERIIGIILELVEYK